MQVTIIIPIYNGCSTLPLLFESLEQQKDKKLVAEVIFIDDHSKDESAKVISELSKHSSFNIKIVFNSLNIGLASTYNKGIKLVKTEYFILMHQDIVLNDLHALSKLLQPLLDNKNIIATFPSFIYPRSVWELNNFWQQALFSRIVGKPTAKLNGKFDCMRSSAKLFFDHERYRTAGEDFDYEMRLKRIGQVYHVDMQVEHIQESNNSFLLRKLVRKEAQLAECYGVNIRRYFNETQLIDKLILLSRTALLIILVTSIFISPIVTIMLLILYSYTYTAKTYQQNFRNPRVFILLIINSVNLLVYNYFFLKGFLTARQSLRY